VEWRERKENGAFNRRHALIYEKLLWCTKREKVSGTREHFGGRGKKIRRVPIHVVGRSWPEKKGAMELDSLKG